jgi:pimeloyl-ACP methyl ester carboxylesterase
MSTVTSGDGTLIAYDRIGDGPPVILVDGALGYRAFGPMPPLAALLAPHFTVFTYDRRGRGESGDTVPYAVEREIEDLAALIEEAGGSARLYGGSSGAGLVLEAARVLPGIVKMSLYEPPFISGGDPGTDHLGTLTELVAAGRRGDALEYFMKDMVGTRAEDVAAMRKMPMWPILEAIAHTLPYDTAVMGNFHFSPGRYASIDTPALVMDGEKTDERLRRSSRAVAGALPDARHHTLEGQAHDVAVEVLAPLLINFFTD